MQTKAKWDPASREWILNGGKMWITNSPIADVALVWARCEADSGAVRTTFAAAKPHAAAF